MNNNIIIRIEHTKLLSAVTDCLSCSYHQKLHTLRSVICRYIFLRFRDFVHFAGIKFCYFGKFRIIMQIYAEHIQCHY
jgi:hypothetical protein